MDRSPDTASLSFRRDGAQLFGNALGPLLAELIASLAHLPPNQAGVRIHGVDAVQPFLAVDGVLGAVAASIIGTNSRAVRAILFDKTAQTNWSLAWHQDRTICVARKQDVEGFGPWTVKAGMHHVTPPFDLLRRMVTLRAHLDDVPITNAPLLIAPGSHKAGRVPESEIEALVRKCGVRTCLAEAGDIWLYATPILHASAAAEAPARRRVLQVDYAAEDLPAGLEWLGV